MMSMANLQDIMMPIITIKWYAYQNLRKTNDIHIKEMPEQGMVFQGTNSKSK